MVAYPIPVMYILGWSLFLKIIFDRRRPPKFAPLYKYVQKKIVQKFEINQSILSRYLVDRLLLQVKIENLESQMSKVLQKLKS